MNDKKVFVAFNGADMVPKVNGITIGEFQSVEYTDRLSLSYQEILDYQFVNDIVTTVHNEPRIKGKIKAVFFDDATLRAALDKQPHTEFVLEYVSEYGQGARETFLNPRFTKRYVERSVDKVLFTDVYEFEADDVKYEQFTVKPFHPDREITFDDDKCCEEPAAIVTEGGDFTVAGDLIVKGKIKIQPKQEEDLNREVL